MAENLSKGICPKCGQYWPSGAAMKRHAKCHQKCANVPESKSEEEDNVDDEDDEIANNETTINDRMPVLNVFDLFKNSAFVKTEVEVDEEN